MTTQIDFRILPFVGRKKELALLKARFSDALDNQGSGMLIEGDAGSGKTRLVDEFISRIGKDAFVLTVSLNARTSSARELVSALIRSYLKKTSHGARIIMKVVDEQMYDEFHPAIPELSMYYPFEAKAASSAGVRPDIRELFFRLISNLAAISPVIVVVEDLHEAADDAFQALEYLLQNINARSVAVIMTARPNVKVRQWHEHARSGADKRVSLAGLERESVIKLNDLLFHASLHESFLDWLYDRTKGVPLFVSEFLLSLAEKGVLFYDRDQSHWRTIESYSQIAIPAEVTAVIKSRFTRLSRNETEFLETAAVMGYDFDPALPVFKPDQSAIQSLLRTGIIVRNDGGYSFGHPLIRDILYEQIPKNARLIVHRRLARFFLERRDKELAADHLSAAGVKNNKLMDLLVEVGQDLQKKGAYTHSSRYVERALAIARTQKNISQKRMLEILLSVSKNRYICEKYEECHELSDPILGSFKEHPRLSKEAIKAYYYNQLVQTMIFLGKYHDALKIAQRALKMFRDSRRAATIEKRIELEITRVSVLRNLGDIDYALNLALEIERKYGRNAVPHIRYNIYRILGSIYHARKDYQSAIVFRRRALSIAEESGVERVIAGMKGNLGVSLALSGKLKEGIECVRQCQQYDIRAGRIRDEIVCHLHIAEFSFTQGFLPQAESEYKQAIDRCRQFERLRDVVFEAHCQYAKFLVFIGRIVEAHRYLEKAIKVAENLNVPVLQRQALLSKGIYHAALKDGTGLDKILEKINTHFKDHGEKEIEFRILEGFRAIIGGKTRNGFMKINSSLNELTRGQDFSNLFMLSYFCARILKNDMATSAQADTYFNKAIGLAEQYQMTGWLNMLKPDSVKTAVEPLRISCLGGFRIEHPINGLIRDEQWQRIKPKQLLSILVTDRLTGMRLTRGKIAALLWPELSGAKVASNFHACLYQLKALIGKDHVRHAGGVYTLEHAWIDACEFKRMVGEAETLHADGKVHLAESRLDEAIRLYQGGFIEDMYDPWIDGLRKELASQNRKCLLLQGDIHLRKLHLDRAEHVGRSILNADPLDEEGHRFLIRTYLLSGERAKAIRQYEKCAEIYKRELNCLPSEETREMYRKIMH